MDAIYIGDAMQRSGVLNNTGSRHSPKSSMNSPNVEMADGSDAVRYRLAKEMLPPGKNTDWLWDWSSRPEAVPPKEYNRLFSSRHGSGNEKQKDKDMQGGIATALTTPPNSPIPSPDNYYGYSWRHTALVRGDMLNADVVLGLIVSNLVTFLLGACIGYCVCLRVKEQKALE
jgi:BCL2/adenovirus E1B protein-interacting protein 3